PAVVTAAVAGLRATGVCGLVGAGGDQLVFDPNALFGKTVVGIFDGNADPQQFIPRMIELWQDGRFPFDRLIETYALSQIDETEQASLAGSRIKPVLLPELVLCHPAHHRPSGIMGIVAAMRHEGMDA